jgi:hypothetical protein
MMRGPIAAAERAGGDQEMRDSRTPKPLPTRRALLVVVLACISMGASASAGATTDQISKKAASTQYLRLVGPTKSAASKFSSEASAWTSSTTDSQAEADAKPFIAAITKLDSGLTHDRWPNSAKADVKSLVSADATVIGDLRSLSTLQPSAAASFVTTFDRDAKTLSTSATALRHDVGLPPAKS